MDQAEEYGLIGFPLSHSFSATWFNTWFEQKQNKAVYSLFEIPEIHDISRWILEHAQLRGFNVTIPHKRHIIKFLDETSPIAKEIGAVNAVRVEHHKDHIKLHGTNTDWLGFTKAVLEIGLPQKPRALVLGTGGAALAAAFALRRLGIEHSLVSRNPKECNILSYKQINRQILASHNLIINAAPWGMYPDINTFPPIPYKAATQDHLFYDMVYNPQETRFMRMAKEAGARNCHGLGMLIAQAKLSWAWWQGASEKELEEISID